MLQVKLSQPPAWSATLILSGVFMLSGVNIHAQTAPIPQPSSGMMPNSTKGKALYGANCASCHGADLQGSDKGSPLLHKLYEPSHHGDAAFQVAARSGVRAHHWKFGDMAPVPAVTPDDVAHITAFIRDVQRKVGIR